MHNRNFFTRNIVVFKYADVIIANSAILQTSTYGQRRYVLLPPTADEAWFVAAAKGGFNGRFTIGFSADDAGGTELPERHVIAVNPHHWPDVLTENWFQQHYPGVNFTAVVANKPADLEAWLRDWIA